MEGPTPVSALIHAATMVTAGVYMVARSHPIFTHAPIAMETSRSSACDRVLRRHHRPGAERHQESFRLLHRFAARLHVPGRGRGRVLAGIFHLMTHAFFKALLFLGAGSVIHALGGEQDMRNMGGLRKKSPPGRSGPCCGRLFWQHRRPAPATGPPVIVAVLGLLLAWWFYIRSPGNAEETRGKSSPRPLQTALGKILCRRNLRGRDRPPLLWISTTCCGTWWMKA
jgi:hypothetical protein